MIYAKDGVIVAVNGSMSADKTALQGVTKAIAFIDNRPDIHNLFIGSTVNGTTITFPKSIYMGWLPLEIRSIQLHPMRIKLFFYTLNMGRASCRRRYEYFFNRYTVSK